MFSIFAVVQWFFMTSSLSGARKKNRGFKKKNKKRLRFHTKLTTGSVFGFGCLLLFKTYFEQCFCGLVLVGVCL